MAVLLGAALPLLLYPEPEAYTPSYSDIVLIAGACSGLGESIRCIPALQKYCTTVLLQYRAAASQWSVSRLCGYTCNLLAVHALQLTPG